jgi:protein phosphatase
MSLLLRAVTRTDPGPVRANNEDAGLAGRRVLAIADGVGGSPAGEVASGIVIKALTDLDESSADSTGPAAKLRAAVDAANAEIREVAQSNPENHGMGTTVTALMLDGTEFGVLHIGDSRGYLLRDREVQQFTRDDTYVQALVDQGVITKEEARRHPQRSLVTRAVHGQHLPPASSVIAARPGDRVLLCSDGLSDFLTDQAIADALRSYQDPDACAERLVKLALQAGSSDNVTVVVGDLSTR